jgi:arsenate reductase-like glutaredoxin family protein
MRKELKVFAEDMEEMLKNHDRNKGDSWKTCNIRYLEEKIDEEYDEYIRTGRMKMFLPDSITFKFIDYEKRIKDPDEIIYLLKKKKIELLDLANMCMMMYDRCNMRIEKIKE